MDPPARRRVVAPQSSIDDLEHRTFQWFWDTANPHTYLVPDRWPTKSFSSIAAVGFGLTAYCIGADRGYVTREQARDRVLATLQSLIAMSTGPQATGIAGYKGFFYHFLDMDTAARYKDVELSTIDTTWLFSGVLFCQSYFDRNDPAEKSIRDLAEELYDRAEWDWAQPRPPGITMGWYPEKGFHTWDWHGYDEAMMLVILALGSPTHSVAPDAWTEYTKTYKWGTFYGQDYVLFAPLFGHQYTHMYIDFRGIQDAYMRAKGIDYFENSRRATIAQRSYAMDNPNKWKDYGANIWGLTACDGPGDMTIDGRTYHSYWGRGATEGDIRDDGTIAPTAAASSIAFTPDISIPAIEAMQKYPGVYREYGFADAFNPTFHNGWVDVDYLGIDQGPIIAMIENYRSGLVWNTMKKNPHVVQGLKRAGFTGGWLDSK
ncbi:MAG TPA: glucoamylase family protein [Thermoanaerobaculia bacterium]|nr:glucoamylase family protein [Thermoanaerobaculia bacterium]